MSRCEAENALIDQMSQLDSIGQEALLASARALHDGATLEEAVQAGNVVLVAYGRLSIDLASIQKGRKEAVQ